MKKNILGLMVFAIVALPALAQTSADEIRVGTQFQSTKDLLFLQSPVSYRHLIFTQGTQVEDVFSADDYARLAQMPDAGFEIRSRIAIDQLGQNDESCGFSTRTTPPIGLQVVLRAGTILTVTEYSENVAQVSGATLPDGTPMPLQLYCDNAQSKFTKFRLPLWVRFLEKTMGNLIQIRR